MLQAANTTKPSMIDCSKLLKSFVPSPVSAVVVILPKCRKRRCDLQPHSTIHQLTEFQARRFAESGSWKILNQRQRALFQLQQDKLCMPFVEFHKAIEQELGRPVYTHEFGLNRWGLLKEVVGEVDPPSLDEILGLLSQDKRIIVLTDNGIMGGAYGPT